MGRTFSAYGAQEWCIQGFRWERERKNHLEDPGVYGKIILKWIFRRWDVGTWTGWSWPGVGTDGGLLRKR